LSSLHSDPTSQHAVQAAFCANINRHYCESLELARKDWTGPIRSPLLTGINLMHESLFECFEAGSKPIHCPVLAAALVKHICADSWASFVAWRDEIIKRLNRFYQMPDPMADVYGEVESRMVVPPQAFDPQVNFDLSLAPKFTDDFLMSVDYRQNPLLVSPEQMKQGGFEGQPYRYL